MYRYKTIVVMLENLHYRRGQIWSGAQPFSGLASKICGIHFQLSWGCCSWVGTLPKQTAQLCAPHRQSRQATLNSTFIDSYPACARGRIWSRSAPARGPEAFRLSVCPVWFFGRLVFSSVFGGFKACHVTAAKMFQKF